MEFKFINMNIIIVTVIILNIFDFVLNDYVAIPFKIFKDSDSIYISDDSFISDYIVNKLYFFLEVGIPYQKLIGTVNSLEYELLMKKGEFCFNQKINYFFNTSISNSFSLISSKTNTYFDSFDSSYVQDNINLCTNYNMEEKKCERNKSFKINFILSKKSTIDEEVSNKHDDFEINYIEIGLNLKTHFGTQYSLYKNLFENKYIENNIWFISYFNDNEIENTNNNNNNKDIINKPDDGMIIFGENPLHFFKDKYETSYILNTNGINRNYDYNNYWSIIFNEIRLKTPDGTKDILFGNDIQGVINHNYKVIVGSEKYMNYIEQYFFSNYISDGRCKKHLNDKFYYYSCNSLLVNFKTIEQTFPTIYLKQVDLNYVFELNATDLFITRGDEIFFLVVFNAKYSTPSFLLGSLFLKKYMFYFNNNNNQITFLREIKKNEKKNMIIIHWYNSVGTIIFLIILFIIIGFLGFYYGKKIYNKRKLRANELEDNFDYQGSINKQNNNKMEVEMKLGVDLN